MKYIEGKQAWLSMSNYRSLLDPIILSTVPHYLVVLLFIYNRKNYIRPVYYLGYTVTIAVSSTLSIMWHRNHEHKNWVFYADYLFAIIWTIYDIVGALLYSTNKYINIVVILNLSVCLINLLVDLLDKQKIISYKYGHTFWHIISITKSIYVVYIIGYKI
jgi:hypothetical protein